MAKKAHVFGPHGDRCSACGADLTEVMITDGWDCIEREPVTWTSQGDQPGLLLRGLSLVDWTQFKQSAVDILWADITALADSIMQENRRSKPPSGDDAVSLAEAVQSLSLHFTDLPYVCPLPTPWQEHMATLREKVPGKD